MNTLEFQRIYYPRVSDIFAPYSKQDYDNVPLEALAHACERGTKIDQCCSNYMLGLYYPEPDEECKPYVDAFIKWADEKVDCLISAKKRLYDDQMKFSGEFDMIVKMKDTQKNVLLDIKATAKEQKSWKVQLAAYKHLCEVNGYEIHEAMNLHLHATKKQKGDESITLVKAKEIEAGALISYWSIFEGCLKAYDYFSRKAAPHA